MDMQSDAHYILGHTDREHTRLRSQSEFMAPFSARMLSDAGLAAGMRVLDVGCGAGDLTRLIAGCVGETGQVVGVDRELPAIECARASTRGLDQVTFVNADLRELENEFDAEFDAVVGRFVLMYLADPTEAIARLVPTLRPGGIVAFQEWTAGDAFLSAPHCPEWHRVTDVVVEAFRQAGTRLNMGLALHGAFLDAGLPAPTVRAERPLGGGECYGGYDYIADVVRAILPSIEQLGIASAAELDPDGLADRLRGESVARRAAVALPTIVTAWSRTA